MDTFADQGNDREKEVIFSKFSELERETLNSYPKKLSKALLNSDARHSPLSAFRPTALMLDECAPMDSEPTMTLMEGKSSREFHFKTGNQVKRKIDSEKEFMKCLRNLAQLRRLLHPSLATDTDDLVEWMQRQLDEQVVDWRVLQMYLASKRTKCNGHLRPWAPSCPADMQLYNNCATKHINQWCQSKGPRQIELPTRAARLARKVAQVDKDAKNASAAHNSNDLKAMRKLCMQGALCINFNLNKCGHSEVGGHLRTTRSGTTINVKHGCAVCGVDAAHSWLDCQAK